LNDKYKKVNSKKKFDLSVVICCYTMNRIKITEKLISQLLNQQEKIQIVLVSDYNKKLFLYLCNKYKTNENIVVVANESSQGLSGGRNTGIKYSKADIVAFIDDDALIHKNWANNLIENFSEESIIGVGGHVIPTFMGKKPYWFCDEIDWIYGGLSYLEPKKQIVQRVRGGNMAFRKHIFENELDFDVNFGRKNGTLLSGDETELCMRIYNFFPKKKIIYNPKVIIYHIIENNRCNLKFIIKRSFYAGISIKQIRKKYSSPHNFTKSKNLVDDENAYIHYLLKEGVFNRIIRLLTFKENLFKGIFRLLTISIVVFFTGLGFLYGKSN